MKVITYLMKVILSVPDEGYSERHLMKVILSVPDEGYYVPDEGYSRKSSCTLKLYIYVFIDFSFSAFAFNNQPKIV